MIAALPAQARLAVHGLDDAQLDTRYRPDGWTVRQAVHHLAESHMNGVIRLKLALTEDRPTVKTYDPVAWADLPDMHLPIEPSLRALEGLHERWVTLLRALGPDQFLRELHYPGLGILTVDGQVQGYSWHCRHHVAHITSLRQREGW